MSDITGTQSTENRINSIVANSDIKDDAQRDPVQKVFVDSDKNDVLATPEDFTSPDLAAIYRVLREKIQRHETVSAAGLTEYLTQGQMSLLVKLLQKPEQLANGERALADYIEKLREQQQERRGESGDLRQLAQQLRERKGFKG